MSKPNYNEKQVFMEGLVGMVYCNSGVEDIKVQDMDIIYRVEAERCSYRGGCSSRDRRSVTQGEDEVME